MLSADGSYVHARGITGAESKRLRRDCALRSDSCRDAQSLRATFVRSFVSVGAHHPSLSVTSLTARSAPLSRSSRSAPRAFDIACLPEAAERQSAQRGSFSEAYFDRTTEDNLSRYSLVTTLPLLLLLLLLKLLLLRRLAEDVAHLAAISS